MEGKWATGMKPGKPRAFYLTELHVQLRSVVAKVATVVAKENLNGGQQGGQATETLRN